MDVGRLQFDILLGGVQELPHDLSLMNFASARAQEVISIAETLQEPPKTGLLFQRLPRHMRRRVMSHNAKRMPRQLREAHLRQMEKGGLPPKSKRPSRKYRRRPGNLLEAYNRRQRENIWLETHIWHAKRFHMINKWGYRLPHFPNDKSARACYRGAANHCLIQDISYYACIELEGRFGHIINGMGMLTRRECGLSFNAKMWLRGDHEGYVTLFRHASKYPHGAIGNVRFLWKPITNPNGGDGGENSNETRNQSIYCDDKLSESPTKENYKKFNGNSDYNQLRKLWIWVHPSCYDEVKEELITTFKFQPYSPPLGGIEPCEEPPPKKRKSQPIKSSGVPNQTSDSKTSCLGDSKLPCNKIMQFTGSNVNMSLLKDTLIRFRLMGPLSNAVLRETVLLAPIGCPKDHPGSSQWWAPWEEVFRIQNQAWKEMEGVTSPAMVSARVVLGLTICDPRSYLPKKRTKAVDIDGVLESGEKRCSIPTEACMSPLWDCEIRNTVTESKPTDAQVNEKHSENLVPGIMEEVDENIASTSRETDDFFPKLPILLIQQPGSQDPSNGRLGYGSGWDVIAPAGWGKALWLALIMRGARAAGIRDAEALENIEVSPSLCWPAPPDTLAGRVEMEQAEKEAREKYFRIPPGKRPNYIKLGISSPFSCPWHILCQEWLSSPVATVPGDTFSGTHYMLRDRNMLQQIKSTLQLIKKKKSEKTSQTIIADGDESYSKLLKIGEGSLNSNDCCLVPVRVTIFKKGTISKCAIICLPRKGDLSKHVSHLAQLERKGVEEKINPDPYQEERQILRKGHKEELRKLRRKRLRMRKEADECTPVGGGVQVGRILRRPIMGANATAEMRTQYKRKMENLFLPEASCVRKSCSREVAGYVISGGFSFLHAKEMGLAYITLPALLNLIRTKVWNPNLFVFVRNTSSLHYTPATIEIISY